VHLVGFTVEISQKHVYQNPYQKVIQQTILTSLFIDKIRWSDSYYCICTGVPLTLRHFLRTDRKETIFVVLEWTILM
jgi:hypothetical protein